MTAPKKTVIPIQLIGSRMPSKTAAAVISATCRGGERERICCRLAVCAEVGLKRAVGVGLESGRAVARLQQVRGHHDGHGGRELGEVEDRHVVHERRERPNEDDRPAHRRLGSHVRKRPLPLRWHRQPVDDHEDEREARVVEDQSCARGESTHGGWANSNGAPQTRRRRPGARQVRRCGAPAGASFGFCDAVISSSPTTGFSDEASVATHTRTTPSTVTDGSLNGTAATAPIAMKMTETISFGPYLRARSRGPILSTRRRRGSTGAGAGEPRTSSAGGSRTCTSQSVARVP